MKSPSSSNLEDRAAAAEARFHQHLLAGDKAEALKSAIEAAELYLKARRDNTSRREFFDKKCTTLLAQAESIKKGDNVATETQLSPLVTETTKSVSHRRIPVSMKPLTVKEETLLLKSSKVNGHVFPPWKGPPTPSEFPTEPFSDPSGYLHLSESQQAILRDWRRPPQICGDEGVSLDYRVRACLTQDLITDCSVVASLCAALRREENGFGKTVTNILFPQRSDGTCVESPSGKYIVKLYFNGSFRKVLTPVGLMARRSLDQVIIDDFLPTSTSNRALYATCCKKPSYMTAALIEKAYLKVMGGYDFPGSNSGTDLLALTGWIPEHVFLQSDDIRFSALWKRMYKAWSYGDLLITVGTGRMTRLEELELGLVGEHDYAVLDMKEVDGDCMMLVKNPWSEGSAWKGAPVDQNEDSEDDFDAPQKDIFETSELKDALSPSSLDPGEFWISLDNIYRNFASIYLNWNPGLFTHRYDTHFTWDLSTKRSETSFGGNPQFSLSSSKATTVWVLLSRHFGLTNTSKSLAKGYIALYLFDSNGDRVYLSYQSLHRAPYVDSPQTLLRLDDFPARTTYTLVISSQDLSVVTHSFTLSVFSVQPVSVAPVKETHPYSITLSSSWNVTNSGGNANTPDYPINPQFQLSVTKLASSITLLLESPAEHAIHVKLVHSKGKRVASVTTRDMLAESGEYKRSTALATIKDLAPGQYTVVASTFETGQFGEFTLTLLSATPDAVLKELPGETAGRFNNSLTGVWSENEREILWPLTVPRVTKVFIKARTIASESRERAALRITLRKSYRDPTRCDDVIVASSSTTESEFSGAPQGVRTVDMVLDNIRGGYVVVLERLGLREGIKWEVDVISDGRVVVGPRVLE